MLASFVKSHRTILLWQLFLAVLFALCLSSQVVNTTLKFYEDFISTGRTDFKLLFFIAYIFVVLSLRFIAHPPSLTMVHAWVIYSALALFALGLAEHLWLFHLYFPDRFYSGMIFMMSDLKFSTSMLAHTHAAKVVLGAIQQFFFNTPWENYDSGSPYLTVFPAWLVMLHVVIFLCFSICAALSLLCFRRLSSSLYAVYVLVAFITIRNSLDGGLFDFQTIAALPGFIVINRYLNIYAFPDERECIKTFSLASAAAVAMLTAIVTLSGMFHYHAYLLKIAIIFLIYFFMYHLFDVRSSCWRRLVHLFAFLYFLIVLTVYVLHSRNIEMGYWTALYPLTYVAGHFYVQSPEPISEETLPPHLQVEARESIGNLLFAYRMKTTAPQVLYEIARDLHIPIMNTYIDIPEQACQSCRSVGAYVRVIASDTESFESIYKLGSFARVELEPRKKDVFYVTAHFNSCLGFSDTKHLLMRILRAIGIRKAAIILDL